MNELALPITDDLLDALAERVAERLAQRQATENSEAPTWLRGAGAIADYIGARPSRVYALHSAGRLPLAKDGSALLARRSDLDAWLANGGGRRP